MIQENLQGGSPRIYLGSLAVMPRDGVRQCPDKPEKFKYEDLGSRLGNTLRQLFPLPHAQEADNPDKSAFVMDVTVLKFQTGESWDGSSGASLLPLMLRPRITVCSRLYHLQSRKTIVTYSVTKRMGLRKYISRVFSWRAVFRFCPLFDAKDMDHLLRQACNKIQMKMQRRYK